MFLLLQEKENLLIFDHFDSYRITLNIIHSYGNKL